MAFTHKQLAVTFDLGEGDLGEAGSTRLKLSAGLKASATITETGGPSFSTLDLTMSGMSLSNMNSKLNTLGQRKTVVKKNTVTVEAGDDVNGLSVVYRGQMIEGWADFSAMPNVVFRVQGAAGALEAVKPIPPTTYSGLVDVVTIMRGLATQADLIFTNDGVTKQLIDPYFPGTIYEQMRRCADHANISWIISNGTLAIWPKGGARGGAVVVISPKTGLIGYPSYTPSGIQLMVLHNPSINFGQKIKVESSITNASGEWFIQTLVHTLESETPGGQWHTSITALPQGLFAAGGVTSR
jgi:hypothetical protein